VFFPEAKDTAPGTPNLREQLLKLPACAAHNTALSLDDEYAAFLVASSITSNSVGRHQAATKVLRALRRRPSLVSIFKRDPREVEVGGEAGVPIPVDRARLDRVFLRIARGLYFHNFGIRLGIELRWTSSTMAHSADLSLDRAALIIEHELRTFPRDDPHLWYRQGAIGHEDVFAYKLWGAPQVDERLTLVRMRFYGGFIVLVTSEPPP
jgi:hypothetical protein